MTNTRLLKVIGLDDPDPGRTVFHARFLVSLQVTGRFFSELIPSPLGPQNCGQFPASATLDRVAMLAIVFRKCNFIVIFTMCASSLTRLFSRLNGETVIFETPH